MKGRYLVHEMLDIVLMRPDVYRRDTDSLQREMIQRLAELEDRVRRQTEMIHTLTQKTPQTQTELSVNSPRSQQGEIAEHGFLSVGSAQTTLSGPSPGASVSPLDIGSAHFQPRESFSQSQIYEGVPFTIPMGHETTTASLFSYPSISNLIGNYSEDLFFEIECHRDLELANLLAQNNPYLPALDLSKDVTDNLVSEFFLQVHPEIPVLDEGLFLIIYEDMMSFGPKHKTDTALCLLVLSLGKLVSRPQDTSHQHALGDGIDLFSAAYHILLNEWVRSFDFDSSLPLGLFFVSVYFCYTSRPLQAWKWVNMTSSTLQLMMNQ